MNDADIKGINAQIVDLQERLENAVKGALLLLEVVERQGDIIKVLVERTEILRTAHLALVEGVSILGEEVWNND